MIRYTTIGIAVALFLFNHCQYYKGNSQFNNDSVLRTTENKDCSSQEDSDLQKAKRFSDLKIMNEGQSLPFPQYFFTRAEDTVRLIDLWNHRGNRIIKSKEDWMTISGQILDSGTGEVLDFFQSSFRVGEANLRLFMKNVEKSLEQVGFPLFVYFDLFESKIFFKNIAVDGRMIGSLAFYIGGRPVDGFKLSDQLRSREETASPVLFVLADKETPLDDLFDQNGNPFNFHRSRLIELSGQIKGKKMLSHLLDKKIRSGTNGELRAGLKVFSDYSKDFCAFQIQRGDKLTIHGCVPDHGTYTVQKVISAHILILNNCFSEDLRSLEYSIAKDFTFQDFVTDINQKMLMVSL